MGNVSSQTFESQRTLTAAEWSRLRAYIQKERGITPLVLSEFALSRCVRRRLDALNLPNVTAYEGFLRDDARGTELNLLVEALLPPETYFFRDPHQLKTFVAEVLPRAKEALSGVRTLRLDSCGCSSGEEPYTLAMLVEESGLFRDWNVEVVGVDWNKRLLEVGQAGVYPERSLRNASALRRQTFFKARGSKLFQVRPPFLSQVSFVHSNLVNTADAAARPKADIVFCRNVLIYFDSTVRSRIVEYLHGRLRTGGWLLLGHSEHLLKLPSRFELDPMPDALVYRAAT
jgi:chemotaxis protein methyltransferase CheR